MNVLNVNLPHKGNSYWAETRRPIYSAALVLPFLIIYELGLFILQPSMINGGDALIKKVLALFSLRAHAASALVLVAFFVVWQIRSKDSWKLDPRKLAINFAESLGYSIVLFLFLGWLSAHLHSSKMVHGETAVLSATAEFTFTPLLELVLYCGAGIYEELVFRVLLLGLLMLVFTKLLHWDKVISAVAAVVIGATLFSLFHYIGGAEEIEINSFLQRSFAGIYFAAIYVTRSFGVAAASHALYDILVGFQRNMG